ncbi:MAG: signal peptidase II [Arachnia propionica]|nr:MAG: signal peptidase II [Arachnia propionica]
MRDVQAARRAPLITAARALAVGIGLVGFGADQLSKAAVLAYLNPGQPVEILGQLLRFTLVRNPGAAFSLGTDFTAILTGFAIIVLVACLTVGLSRVRGTFPAVLLGLLIAGVSGNLFDRLFREPAPMLGHVIDFIQLPYFAIFNVADICITSAAGLLLLISLRPSKALPSDETEAQDEADLADETQSDDEKPAAAENQPDAKAQAGEAGQSDPEPQPAEETA